MDDEQTTPGASEADDTTAVAEDLGTGDAGKVTADAVTASVDSSRGADADTGQAAGTDKATTDDQESSATDDQESSAKAAKVDDLPPWAQKLIKEARQGEGDYRKRAKEEAAARKATDEKLQTFLDGFAKVMGLGGDEGDGTAPEPPDPERLTAELASAQKEHRATQVELAVYRAAGIYEGDPDALLDSRAFLNRVLKLDPTADDFNEKVGSAISEAVSANSKLRVAAQAAATPAAPSGGEFSGGPAGRTDAESLSVDDFRKRRVNRRGN